MQEYVKANWETFIKAINLEPEYDLQKLEAEKVKVAQDVGLGYVIFQQGDEYLITGSTNQENIESRTTDTLDPDMKLKIGLLKLLEVGAYSPGVGIRVSDTSFYVTMKEGKNEA
jgi:hypothetical protein